MSVIMTLLESKERCHAKAGKGKSTMNQRCYDAKSIKTNVVSTFKKGEKNMSKNCPFQEVYWFDCRFTTYLK